MNEVDYPVGVRINKVISETHDVKTFLLNKEISAQPGQFVMAWVPGVDEKPFTLTGKGKTVSITVKKRGKATSKMHEMKEGDILGVRGPYGHGFDLVGKKIVLVGGGYGSAALLMLAEEAVSKGIETTAIIGADTKKNLLFADKIEKLGAKLVVTTDDGSRGIKGFTTQALEKVLAEEKFDCIYTCGPEIMMYYIVQMGEKNNVPVQASLERWIKCGFGVCGQCVLDPTGLRVCKDGPVFGSADLKKISDFGFFARDKTGTKKEWKEFA
ncbi:MAG: dihydroorotate dehydrogenase electron transfer subunit [Candidatus Aenigmarchaeota archaeon]|nr:dihydroorotate dehydrogenase electron transfer subunit [Candidatus Aenigmarchaeota archaeon]